LYPDVYSFRSVSNLIYPAIGFPYLIFLFDETIEYGTHINKLINQVSKELHINDEEIEEEQ